MTWIIITIFAQLLSSVAYIFDKHIVTDTKLKPISYTFYTGIFQILYIAAMPFVGFILPAEPAYVYLGIANGALFILTLIIFYKALKLGEASRVIPVVGASIPIFTAALAFIILNERLEGSQFISFSFLVFGGALMSSRFRHGKLYAIKGLSLAIIAGFFFALYYTVLKLLYDNTHFSSAFILVQIGGFLGALSLIAYKKYRLEIFDANNKGAKSLNAMFVFAKIIAAAAGLMINYAISIEGSKISVINALQSVQYVFILVFAIILAKKMPSFINEQFSGGIVMQKIISLSFIGIGIYLLTT